MGAESSVELCGGTHVSRTGDIGLFKITAEMGIAAGIRRLVAVTGEGAFTQVRGVDEMLDNIAEILKSSRANLVERVAGLVSENRSMTKQLTDVNQKLAASKGTDLAAGAIDVGDVKFLAAQVQGDNKAMMQTLDSLRSQLGDAVIVLAQVSNDKVGMVVGVGKSVVQRIQAPDVLAAIGPLVGAKGGGRADLARAGGGDNPAGLEEAFAAAQTFVRQHLD